MLKALFKKQFLELFKGYFNDRRGRRRSKGKTAAFFALFAALLSFAGFSFFFIAKDLAIILDNAEIIWLYFAIMGLLAVILGTLGSVFNTFTALYKARDNEFLLSLPIPPFKILLVRLASVYFLSLMYESIVFVPTLIAYYIYVDWSLSSVILSFLMIFILALFISSLTCFFGWPMALISSKLKNRSVVTVLIALLFMFGYYYIFSIGFDGIEELAENAVVQGVNISLLNYPLYAFGLATSGNMAAFAAVGAFIVCLSLFTCFVMSKTFVRITKSSSVYVKNDCKFRLSKKKEATTALFIKEWKKFISSASYILNCALGVVFMLVASVSITVYTPLKDFINGLETLSPALSDILPLIPFFFGSYMCALSLITAPSVSLERKSIWVLQSLPIDCRSIIKAKLYVHYLVVMPVAILFSACACIALGLKFYYGILTAAALLLIIMADADIGLIAGLLNPNLQWVNETFAVKQGASVLITLLTGVLTSVLLTVIGCVSASVMDTALYLLIVITLMAIVVIFLHRWLMTKGAGIFAKLG